MQGSSDGNQVCGAEFMRVCFFFSVSREIVSTALEYNGFLTAFEFCLHSLTHTPAHHCTEAHVR